MKILVIAEHDQKSLMPSTLKTMGGISHFTASITVLVAGHHCRAVAEQAATLSGITEVLLIDAVAYKHLMAEDIARLVASVGKNYTHIFAPASTFGKNFMPRVAALLDVGQISDVVGIESENIYKRPIFAGNAIATVQSHDPIQVVTLRPSAFTAAAEGSVQAPIQIIEEASAEHLSEFVGRELSVSSRPELGAARIIISGGRGMQNGENFKMLEQLADRLGAAIGASRAAVDAGFVPNDYQVGQTGKIVAPDLYIAVGISGAIQHLAGMKESKVIVAINKDPDAPIFQVADYGLVGDLFQIIPELEARLAKMH